MEANFSNLCQQATVALLYFPTTYLCEAGFSTLTLVKTKYGNKLPPEDDTRCALTTIIPNFDKLVKQVQGQSLIEIYTMRVSPINKTILFLIFCYSHYSVY